MNRLITIKFSHYNEKARWALDRCGVPFVEDAHLPMLHFPAVLRASPRGGVTDRVSTRYSTPLLVTASGPISESTEIAKFAAKHVGPEHALIPADVADEVEELDRWFGLKLGPATRCYGYHHMLRQPALMKRLAALNVPGLESKVWSVIFPLMSGAVRRSLRVNPATAQRAHDRIVEIFDAVGAKLADGRRYLVGDRFTLADLSFAALAAPALLIEQGEGFDARLPTRVEAPAVVRAFADELRATRAGRHAVRMFAEERGSVANR